ncbi:hypothetical protein WMY93_005907 [Mugilogobius chulae]|uniref:DUF6589 domain-containing protein n=1 Tax=Mugilogobius chulae TaxID=88201 RepID=A0AAW0PIB8_9GOBI
MANKQDNPHKRKNMPVADDLEEIKRSLNFMSGELAKLTTQQERLIELVGERIMACSTTQSSVNDCCRLCTKNLRIKGVIGNSENIFEKRTQERTFANRCEYLGLVFKKDKTKSHRICKPCSNVITRLERDFTLLNKWKLQEQNGDPVPVQQDEQQRQPVSPQSTNTSAKRVLSTPSKTPRLVKKIRFLPTKPSSPKSITQYPLGLIFKNENKTSELIDALEYLQNEYVPKGPDGMSTVVVGGDRLTEGNSRNIQWAFADGVTKEKRLEGMVFRFEDWHAIRNLMEIHFKIFFKTSSAKDHGTLFANMNTLSLCP